MPLLLLGQAPAHRLLPPVQGNKDQTTEAEVSFPTAARHRAPRHSQQRNDGQSRPISTTNTTTSTTNTTTSTTNTTTTTTTTNTTTTSATNLLVIRDTDSACEYSS